MERVADRDLSEVTRVTVFGTLEAAEISWRALQARAAISPYQRYAWVHAWCRSRSRIEPAILVAYDAADRPLALLPCELVRRAGLRVGQFLGAKDSNCNLGLFAPEFEANPGQVRALLRSLAAIAGLDLLVLRNQPPACLGRPNPMHEVRHQPSPSASRSAALPPDPEHFFKTVMSKHARKLLRQKETRLRLLGPVVHRRAQTVAEVDGMLEAYQRQKAVRFDRLGVSATHLADEATAFLRDAADPRRGRDAPVELHALTCGDEIVAVLAGAVTPTQFSGMVIAFESRLEVARNSPGDLLIAAVIADLCRRGFEHFDLGIGEARYKETFCNDLDPRFDSYVGVTLVGRLAAQIWSRLADGKRAVKQSRTLWTLVGRGRLIRARVKRFVGH